MANLAKITRELLRIPRQMAELPANLYSYFFSKYYYDLFLAKKSVQHSGSHPTSDRIAIFVIYPKTGLLTSHLHTLDYFTKNGYATVVVSNKPLSKKDQNKVLKTCWRYIERPNYGYDFGAYREGILNIAQELPKLRSLVLINDSVWFPLPDSKDWLDEVAKLDVNFAGAASHFGLSRVDPLKAHATSWEHTSKHRSFHYCSFALSVSNIILTDPDFLRFWKTYPLSNKKMITVKRGEKGLTKWIISKGYSHGCTLNYPNIETDLKALDEQRLLEIANNLILLENPNAEKVKQDILAKGKANSRQSLIDLILFCAAYQGPSYALADYLINNCKFPFLKKSPLGYGGDARKITSLLVKNLDDLYGTTLLSEAAAIYKI